MCGDKYNQDLHSYYKAIKVSTNLYLYFVCKHTSYTRNLNLTT